MRKNRKLILSLSFMLVCMFIVVGLPTETYAAGGSVKISSKNFPDKHFRKYVKRFDKNKNGYLSKAERKKVRTIKIGLSKKYRKYIDVKSLKGLQYFTELRVLDLECCDYIKTLDLRKNKKLKKVNCDMLMGLKTVKLGKNKNLTYLYCTSTLIKTIDLTGCPSLKTLGFTSSKIRKLNLSKNESLVSLWCNACKLTTINVSHNRKLKELNCAGNKLTSLNVSNNSALEYLLCFENRLTSLDVSNNPALRKLACQHNKIPTLNIEKCPNLVKAKQGKKWIWYDYFQYTDGKSWEDNNCNKLLCDKTTQLIY